VVTSFIGQLLMIIPNPQVTIKNDFQQAGASSRIGDEE
jgi:hypothetical protein